MERPAVRTNEGDKLVHLTRNQVWDDHPFLRLTMCGFFVYFGDKSLTKHASWRASPSDAPISCFECLDAENKP